MQISDLTNTKDYYLSSKQFFLLLLFLTVQLAFT